MKLPGRTPSITLATVALLIGIEGCAPRPAAPTRGPSRVISTAPSITEMIFALGAGDQLVGVTTYCDYPDAAQSKPRIGSFAAPSMEAVLAQSPDLVVVLADRQDLEAQFTALNLPVLMLDVHDLVGVLASLEELAETLGRKEAGVELAGTLRQQLKERRARSSTRPLREVLILVGRNPGSVTDLYAVGRSSYLADLVEVAGGQSVFRDSAMLYPKVSIEEVLVRDPEIILELSQMGQQPTAEDLQAVSMLWEEFPSLRAVRDRRVFVLNEEVLLVPGPRMIDGIDRLLDIFEGLPR